MKLNRIVLAVIGLAMLVGCSQQVPSYQVEPTTKSTSLFVETCQGLICVLDFSDGKQCVTHWEGGVDCEWPRNRPLN